MANNAVKIVGGCMIEIIREDACGLPLVGVGHTNNAIRSKGAIQLDLTPDVDTGTDLQVRGMCGDLCINEKDSPIIKGLTGKLKLCAVDPAILNLMVGLTPIMDTVVTTQVLGARLKGESRSQTNKFTMKIWAVPTAGCTSTGKPWVVFCLPFCENAVISNTISFAHRTHQAWEIDFYAREGNASFSDPTGVFSPSELSKDLMGWKAYDTIPTESEPGVFLSI